ncbi:MAG: nuclear transport factor 2 family protein [Sphingomonadales bacterium]
MSSSGPLEDRLAIRELAERYCDGIIRLDPEIWGSTWAEDGIWFHAGLRTEGRDKIVAEWMKSMEPIEAIGFFCMMAEMHVVEDTAKGRVYYHHLAKHKDGGRSQVVVSYDDAYVKRSGQWYFKERLITNILKM